MNLKEDLKDAQDRMAAWWEGEKGDRPVVAYHYSKAERKIDPTIPAYSHWYLPQHLDQANAMDIYTESFIQDTNNKFFGAEAIPMNNINYGPGIMAAIFGCVPRFYKRTVWFDHPTPLDHIVDLLESAQLNDNNPWYKRLMRETERAAELAKGRYSVGVTDLGGILDILISFISFKDLILTMRKQPGIIDTCRAIVMEKWHRIFDDLTAILDKYHLGCNAWLDVWSPKHWYPIQCDISASLSPKLFERFVLPDLIEQADRMEYCVYHWDGPDQLKYAEEILEIPNLFGVQWVPGVNQPVNGSDDWMPLYKKIQAKGKRIITDTKENMGKMYRELDPHMLFVSSDLGSEIAAEFYKPEFVEGMGGIDEDDY